MLFLSLLPKHIGMHLISQKDYRSLVLIVTAETITFFVYLDVFFQSHVDDVCIFITATFPLRDNMVTVIAFTSG